MTEPTLRDALWNDMIDVQLISLRARLDCWTEFLTNINYHITAKDDVLIQVEVRSIQYQIRALKEVRVELPRDPGEEVPW